MIERAITKDILAKISTFNKVIVIYGPRQVGKTTLANTVIQKLQLKTLSINADESEYISVLSSRSSRKMANLIGDHELLFIDEAQRVPDIGINLKILTDQFPHLKIIATGSSSFELANKVSEPLTGRKWTFHLFPISQYELASTYTRHELQQRFEERLVFGSYPELLQLPGDELRRDYLRELEQSYLYKDVLHYLDMPGSRLIKNLLRLLAFQIGNEVSIHELGTQLGCNFPQMQHYIDLLEKVFLIFSLGGYSKNLRKEVTKKKKYYFYDLGVRNILIDRLQPLNKRDDVGQLWENFCILERLKYMEYTKQFGRRYFWRLYTGAEIDYVEEREGRLHGVEIKWSTRKQPKAPASWQQTYPDASFHSVNPDTAVDFIVGME